MGVGGFCVPERTMRVMLSFTKRLAGTFVLVDALVTGSMGIATTLPSAFTAPQMTLAFRSFLRAQPRIARAFSPLPGSAELLRCFPQFRVDQQSAC